MTLTEVPQELLTALQTGLLWSFLVPRFRYPPLVHLPHPQNMNTSSEARREPAFARLCLWN